jgi:transcriptional regulator
MMYIPPHFEETRTEVMHALMRAQPLATLITLASDGITANHIPLLLSDTQVPLGTLQGHVARANPLWRDLSSTDVLAIFQGAEAYISPSWYPTKKDTGKVVPTWNYAVVHAHAELRVVDDASWLKAHLSRLTAMHEAGFPQPWALSDAPEEYIERLIGGVIGIELSITRLSGKWKVSQNQPAENQVGVIQGLQARRSENDLLMANLVADSSKTPA